MNGPMNVVSLLSVVLGVTLYCTETLGLWGMFVVMILPNLLLGVIRILRRTG